MNLCFLFFVQAEDGIRDLVRSRGLGDVYKRQDVHLANVQKSILIKWSLVVNRFTYLSESYFFTELTIIELSIKLISCPKTDCPKK